MRKLDILIGFCLCLATVARSQSWQPVGPNDFAQPSSDLAPQTTIALDGSTPYIAYSDGGNSSKATVKKFDGTNWVTVGPAGFSTGAATFISLVINGSTPYIAYRDAGNGSKAIVMKFDGAAWVPVGLATGFSTGAASYTSLAFDGSTPYIAYADAGNSSKAILMKFDGAAWVPIGPAIGFSTGAALYTSLAFNGSTPYVAYQDGSAGKATVMKYNNATSAWDLVGTAGFTAQQATNIFLAFDGSMPYVASREGTAGNFKTTVMKFNAGSWSYVGPAAGFSAGTPLYISLAVKSGTPYVAYTDASTTPANRVIVMKYNGAAWVAVGPATISLSTSLYTSMLLDGGGEPYVAFQDGGNGNKASVMKFNSATSAWAKVGTNGISEGSAADISLAFNGSTPYAAFRDFSTTPSNKAIVMKFDGNTWTPAGPATGFSALAANNISLAFDGSTPYVAYRDGNTVPANKVTVMKFNSVTSTWDLVGPAGFSTGATTYTSLVFDGNTPYVAYNDVTNGKVTVMKFDGAAWVPVGPATGFSAGTATYISLVMNGGTPYVAYNDVANGKAMVMKFDGVNWVTVGAVTGFSTGAVSYASLAFNGNTPYVAYQDGSGTAKATVMTFNSATSTWDLVGTAGFSAGAATYISLVINGGTPYVAYRDAGNGNKATVMKFDGTGWAMVGTGSSAGPVTNTFLASNGNTLYLAYSSAGGGAFAKSLTISALPLKLLSFRANRSGSAALLDWTTASEENTAYFDLQGSVDGRSFTKLGTISAYNNAGTHQYTFTDAGFAGQNVPVVYYRLKMVDEDGHFTYSQIAALNAAQKQESAMIYPNPVKDLANIMLTTRASEKIAWQLVDASGKTVMNGSHVLAAGKNEFTVATAALGAGLYTLRIDGAATHAQLKVMKQ